MGDSEVPEIERLLVEAAKDPAAAPAFVTALLESTVIVPGTASGDRTANLADLLGPGGASVQPFFASEVRLSETVDVVPGFERHFFALPCRVLVGEPARVPPGMTDALSALFARHPAVDEAVLEWKVTPQEHSMDESGHLLAGVRPFYRRKRGLFRRR